MKTDINIIINEESPANLGFDISTFFKSILKEKAIEMGTFELNFVSIQSIQSIHQHYLSDPSHTDIISFHLGDNPLVADIYICHQVARENAIEHQFSYDKEIQLLLIHGLLHCIGYDDLNPIDYERMNAEQHRLLEKYHV